ncbi:MAG: hypothetical protein Q8Q31_05370 [Nanoarchaeota archaeon]|nr:hypothetical protein [Nanoarchaeota archaeon]
MESLSEIQKFTHEFFTNLKCEVSWNGKILIVRNIPKSFESFAGKKGPYYLVFDSEDMKENFELMAKGGFLLKAMASYLESVGQTALLKIESQKDLHSTIRDSLGLQNCDFYNFHKRSQFILIERFTFLTTLQYVNEKEQKITEVYIQDGKVINFDLSNYKTSNGAKEEISFGDIKPAYSIAKSHLRSLLDPKIKEVSDQLSQTLDKEIKRVTEHYDKNIQEHTKESEKQKQIIEDIKTNLLSGKDVPNSKAKLDRAKDILEKFESEKTMEKLLKEKEFFINDEMHKHSLSIDNKLINTTLIYYPIHSCSFSLRSPDVLGKEFEIAYNTVTGEITPVPCEVCSLPLKSTTLCSSGHAACSSCISSCPTCRRPKCKACSVRLCTQCGQESCRKCLDRCTECSQQICSRHFTSQSSSQSQLKICSNCIQSCAFCSNKNSIKQMKRCLSCRRLACHKCSENLTASGCKACTKQCSTCGNFLSENQFRPMKECSCRGCSDLRRCSQCRISLCPILSRNNKRSKI